MKIKLIDNGFYAISKKDANILAKGKLSKLKYGWEKLVKLDGKEYWLARTVTGGKVVWSIREVKISSVPMNWC